jgi:hypothetical protein
MSRAAVFYNLLEMHGKGKITMTQNDPVNYSEIEIKKN